MAQSLTFLRRKLLLFSFTLTQAEPGIVSAAAIKPAGFNPWFSAPHVFAVEDIEGSKTITVTVYRAVILLVVCALLGIGILEMGIDVTGIGAAFIYASYRNTLVAHGIMIIRTLICFTQMGARIKYHVARGTGGIDLAIMIAFCEVYRAYCGGLAPVCIGIVG